MTKIEICKVFEPDKIDVISDLAENIWNEYYVPIIGREQVKYMLENIQSSAAIKIQIDNGYSYYLLKHEDEYAGYFGIKPENNSIFISKLYVKSEFRGKGFAKTSLEFIESFAKKENLPAITLTVNKNNIEAIEAYKQMGFKITGEIIQDIGHNYVMDDYKMEKQLV